MSTKLYDCEGNVLTVNFKKEVSATSPSQNCNVVPIYDVIAESEALSEKPKKVYNTVSKKTESLELEVKKLSAMIDMLLQKQQNTSTVVQQTKEIKEVVVPVKEVKVQKNEVIGSNMERLTQLRKIFQFKKSWQLNKILASNKDYVTDFNNVPYIEAKAIIETIIAERKLHNTQKINEANKVTGNGYDLANNHGIDYNMVLKMKEVLGKEITEKFIETLASVNNNKKA
jgi:hypothetical protein